MSGGSQQICFRHCIGADLYMGRVFGRLPVNARKGTEQATFKSQEHLGHRNIYTTMF